MITNHTLSGRAFAVATVLIGLSSGSLAAEVTARQQGDDVVIEVDGKPFTQYQTANGPKPILFPVIGPAGQAMTRSYPMEDVDGERQDHPHHRSLWFTHGDVNGIDFWSESGRNGVIRHREYLAVEDGATVKSVNDWLDVDGNKVCEDVRTLRFAAGDGWRSIDFDITITASEGPLKFGDTKEGTMGIRVPTVLDVKQKDDGPGGHILTSEGIVDGASWGKRAAWVDYYGDINGQTVGVAMLNHPTSFRHPTYWHVRTYGLFAANPFGVHDFLEDDSADGSHELAEGETLTMRHRLIFHTGDTTAANIAAAFERYAAGK